MNKEHPYITKREGVCDGRACIEGTRITVQCIVEWHLKQLYTLEEILQMYPDLRPEQVYDALSYYYDHKEEIDQEIQEQKKAEQWAAEQPSKLLKRIKQSL